MLVIRKLVFAVAAETLLRKGEARDGVYAFPSADSLRALAIAMPPSRFFQTLALPSTALARAVETSTANLGVVALALPSLAPSGGLERFARPPTALSGGLYLSW